MLFNSLPRLFPLPARTARPQCTLDRQEFLFPRLAAGFFLDRGAEILSGGGFAAGVGQKGAPSQHRIHVQLIRNKSDRTEII